jgi:hypothetical protein
VILITHPWSPESRKSDFRNAAFHSASCRRRFTKDGSTAPMEPMRLPRAPSGHTVKSGTGAGVDGNITLIDVDEKFSEYNF